MCYCNWYFTFINPPLRPCTVANILLFEYEGFSYIMTFRLFFSGFSRAEAQRLQKEVKTAGSSGAIEIIQEQRPALKFGFGSKPVASKVKIFNYQYLYF